MKEMENPYYEIIVEYDPQFLKKLKTPKIHRYKQRSEALSQVSHLRKQGLKNGRHFNAYLRDSQ